MKRSIPIVCVVVIVATLGVPTVSAGVGYLDESGIVSWGRDDWGQVSDTPAGTDFAAVAAGYIHSLALKTNGSLVAWGRDNYGQVSGTPGGTDFAAVAGGDYYGLALKTDGALVSWGEDGRGQVSDTPAGTGFAAAAAGGAHSLAVKTDGSLVAWGWDDYSQVGDTPAGTGFVAVAAGYRHSLTVKTDGSLVAWGNDDYGEVSDTPAGIDFAAVAAGYSHSLAVKTDGSLVSWGCDQYHQISDTPAGTGFAAVAAGFGHSLALKTDGALVSWGLDEYAQVRHTPVSGYYLDIAAGRGHSLALKARQEYEDLVVTGTGARALLQRDVSVSGNVTIDTMMTLENNPNLEINGELLITANAGASGSGSVACDTLRLQGATLDATNLDVESAEIVGNGTFNGAFQGDAVTVDGGDLTVGDPDDYAGFHAGSAVVVGVHTLTVKNKGFASLGISTTLDGGMLVAAAGVVVGPGKSLSGSGTVEAKVSAGFGSTIVAAGPLSLGDADAFDGFFSDGSLITGANTVTLLDRNQAVVGSLTQLGMAAADGTLVADNGLLLEFGKNVVGRGTVDTPNDPLTPLTNNGAIAGDFPGAIELAGYVKGIGTLDNVTITGTLSPGLSIASLQVGNLDIDPAGELLMELGDPSAGCGHDQLLSTGILSLAGTLNVDLIGQFAPRLGNEFDLFDGMISGQFDTLDLPGLAEGLNWDTTSLYTDGVLVVVPEPATLSLLALGGLAVLRRRRKRVGFKCAREGKAWPANNLDIERARI